jgi:DNA-binding response OmpR family regulator
VRTPDVSAFLRQRVVVAENDAVTVDLITRTLRGEGYRISVDPDVLSSRELLAECYLLISSLQVAGVVRMDLLEELREQWPDLPILFLAHEGPLRGDLPSLCVPFTSEELQAAVRRLLRAQHDGTVLAPEVRTRAG